MSDKNTKTDSSTDWERIDNMRDEDIDTSDIPALDDEWFAKAEVRLPKPKSLISIRLDPDVLTWFKEQGPGYQTRMNAVLRLYMEAHKESVSEE